MARFGCCGHLITDLLVEGAKRFVRIHSQVGVGYILVYVARVEQNAGPCGMRVHGSEV